MTDEVEGAPDNWPEILNATMNTNVSGQWWINLHPSEPWNPYIRKSISDKRIAELNEIANQRIESRLLDVIHDLISAYKNNYNSAVFSAFEELEPLLAEAWTDKATARNEALDEAAKKEDESGRSNEKTAENYAAGDAQSNAILFQGMADEHYRCAKRIRALKTPTQENE